MDVKCLIAFLQNIYIHWNSIFLTFLEAPFPQIPILDSLGFYILRRENPTKGLQDFSENSMSII
jgi:hypothetical protein